MTELGNEPFVRIGTSGFTAPGWPGTFYPKNLPTSEYLSYYASQFDTVELVSTLYGPPQLSTVKRWHSKTPPNFVFAVKMPRRITHEKVLRGCDREVNEFLRVMDGLEDKLGPLVFKFRYFTHKEFPKVDDFLERLIPFVKSLPLNYRFAVGIQNEDWIVPHLLDTLRSRGIVLISSAGIGTRSPVERAYPSDGTMPDFVYVRLSGKGKQTRKQTMVPDRTVSDHQIELSLWADVLGQLRRRRIGVFAYATNHYEGHAPGTAQALRKLLGGQHRPSAPQRGAIQSSLFDDGKRNGY
jgi:uncharacterized protein YecE (DUF72 family)